MVLNFNDFINESKNILDVIDLSNGLDFNQLLNVDGGGICNIQYNIDKNLIEQSPLNKKQKENNSRGKNITYDESQSFDKKLFLTMKDGIKIYLIDANYVRKKIDIDYTMGGHAYVYPKYVPEDEVWIDIKMVPSDQFATAVHELVERNLMKNKNITYSKAHDEASRQEKKIRKILN